MIKPDEALNSGSPWMILAIDPTDDIRTVRKAYNKAVRMHHPEEDPGGFMVVREAYENILKLLERAAQIQAVVPQDIDTSILAPYFQETFELYQNFWNRIQPSQWKQLFLSMNFEIYDLFEENAVDFFNKFYHLPTDVWRYLNEKFSLLEAGRFLRQNAYWEQLDFSFQIFKPDITWDYEKYIELRYQGACAQAEKQYDRALACFQAARDIYDGEWALQQRINQLLYILKRLEEANAVFETIAGHNADPKVKRLLIQIREQAQADGCLLLNDQQSVSATGTRNVLYLCLYNMLLLYGDLFQRIDRNCWENYILNIPQMVQEDFAALAPYIFNICCYLPRSVWALVTRVFSLEQKPAFLKRWILHSYAKLDFSLFVLDMDWDFEHYVELWYDGMEAYEHKEYIKALPCLQAAYEIYRGDRKLAEALAETYLATGNISGAKRCHLDSLYNAEPGEDESQLFEMKVNSIIFEKEESVRRQASLYKKCCTCLTQKAYGHLFLLSLAYWFHTKGSAMAQIFLLQSLFMPKKYRLLHCALMFCHTAKHDNFMGALLYAQMEQAETVAPYSFMVTESQLRQIRKSKTNLLTYGVLSLVLILLLAALIFMMLLYNAV